ncbi:TetR/AcrR family transcriptional regulator [Photobacterium makurazakiensis]|uniref:TetR/AcrR family transcriptional regulator n=1 Tax=Photobacterium makurazakiensis TaxID=2910234 RepID=UPI003D0C0D57
MTARSAQKRDQIMKAATALFCEHGYAISMDAIAIKAEVSKQTVYSHFKTKDDLFDTCIRKKCISNQLDISLIDDVRPAEEVLFEFGWRFQNLLLSDEAKNTYKTAVSQSDSHPDLAKVFLNAGPKNTTDMLASYIENLVKQNVLSADIDASDAAMQLLLMFHGRVVYWGYLGQDSGETVEERKKYLKTCVELFLRGYKR